VKTFSSNHPDVNLKGEMSGLEASINSIEAINTMISLRGLEGNAARTYFQGLGKMVLGAFEFTGRKKRPSTDPVNALLSFGYTLLFNEISSLLDGLGFDPYLGYYHEVEYGRASLACDIQEEFRSVVDRFTLYLVNNRMLSNEDFYRNPKDGSMYLRRETMKKYFVEYEKHMSREFKHNESGQNTTIRKCFRMQSEKLAGAIRGGDEYSPFIIEE